MSVVGRDARDHSMLLQQISYFVSQAIEEAFSTRVEDIPLEFPQDRTHGDLTVNAFLLAKALRLAPPRIAEELARSLAGVGPIDTAAAVKGFVNLRLAHEAIFQSTVPPLLADPEAYGRGKELAGKKLLIEFSAPNTNKPLHLGHMRNNFLGDSVSRILANAGAEVVRANLYNDRGIHICKSMLAYERFGNGETPESAGEKSDHFVGRYYVLFEQKFQEEVLAWLPDNTEHWDHWREKNATDRKGKPVAEEDLKKKYVASFREEHFGLIPLGAACQKMLRDWEAGDAQVRELWERMNAWTFDGFGQTYSEQGIAFDAVYRESETYADGKDRVLEGLEKGVFQKREDGAIEIDLRAEKLDKKVVLRSDGTSVYITQDIGTTIKKANDHEVDGQIWVVGNEQDYHFKVLFKILKRMGFAWADDLYHLSYGMVHLPDGRMKTREGRVVDADDLLKEVEARAVEEIDERDPTGEIGAEEKQARARAIALAALRFMLLRVTPEKEMTFDPEASVKFEGETGPRILYAYARLRSMLNEGGVDGSDTGADLGLLEHDTERHLALDLLGFPGVTSRAARERNPQAIGSFLLDLVRDLNRFYDRCPILKEENEELRRARLALCLAASRVIERGAGFLGLPLLQRM